MGIAGRIGASGDVARSLTAVYGRVCSASAPEPRIWDLEGLSLGICGDATSAKTISPPTRLLFEGHIHDRASLLIELNLHDTSVSDASLMLQAWLRFQEEFPAHIIGEYVFAIWDAGQRRLMLGCDPLGSYGVHYWQGDRSFRFATEIGSLIACPEIPIAPNDAQAANWLALDPNSGEGTLYKGIQNVPAGHVLELKDSRLRLHRYWHPENIPSLHLADPREYTEGLLHHMQQAVRCRILPGQNIGTHMSGGLDSSSVSALAASILAEDGRTATAFTAVPAGPLASNIDSRHFGDEREHAASVAQLHANLKHVPISNHTTPFFEALDYCSREHQCPILNAPNATWIVGILAEAQRMGIQTLLCGSMGNLTASYKGQYALRKMLAGGRMLDWFRLAMGRRRLGYSFRDSVRQSLGNSPAQVWFRNAVRNFALSPLRRLRAREMNGESGQNLYHMSPVSRDFFRTTGLSTESEDPGNAPETPQLFRLKNLQRGQGGAMVAASKRCFGLQYSDPMADRRLVEFCISVPEEEFCRGGLPRSLIRGAMMGKLPDKIRLERRIGLQSADADVLMANNRTEIVAEFRRLQASDLANRYLEMPALNKLVEEWSSADWANGDVRHQYTQKLMRGISFGRFMRTLEDGSLYSSLRQNSLAVKD
jgi:asparagine synthase (glutamine-hydrolysing)